MVYGHYLKKEEEEETKKKTRRKTRHMLLILGLQDLWCLLQGQLSTVMEGYNPSDKPERALIQSFQVLFGSWNPTLCLHLNIITCNSFPVIGYGKEEKQLWLGKSC